MFHKCKITVVRRTVDKELIDTYLEKPYFSGACDQVKDGQEFMIDNPFQMPEGMCASAWADIRPYIMTISSGGMFDFMKDKNSAIASCTDLFRPVVFKIERVM